MRVSLCIAATLALAASLAGCTRQAAPRQVVCYTSTDQVFAEPVLRAFEQETGIKVRAKYDTEETKSTGLANLIQQEKGRPQGDVFWSSETGRAIALQAAGCLAAYHSPSATDIPAAFKDPGGFWTGFSARARVILYNRNRAKGTPPACVGPGPAQARVARGCCLGESPVRHDLLPGRRVVPGLGRSARNSWHRLPADDPGSDFGPPEIMGRMPMPPSAAFGGQPKIMGRMPMPPPTAS